MWLCKLYTSKKLQRHHLEFWPGKNCDVIPLWQNVYVHIICWTVCNKQEKCFGSLYPGGCFNTKIMSYQNMDAHYKDGLTTLQKGIF